MRWGQGDSAQIRKNVGPAAPDLRLLQTGLVSAAWRGSHRCLEPWSVPGHGHRGFVPPWLLARPCRGIWIELC